MRKIILGAFVLAATASLARQSGIFAVLKSSVAIGKQPGGVFLLPPNQLLRPWGEQTVIPGRPVDMTYDSQRRILAVLNTRSILLLDGSTGTKVADIAARSTSYAGIAFRPGDRELWASETSRNGPDSILIAKISAVGMPGETSRIGLNGQPLPTGIAFLSVRELKSGGNQPHRTQRPSAAHRDRLFARRTVGIRGIQPQQYAGRHRCRSAGTAQGGQCRHAAVRRDGGPGIG